MSAPRISTTVLHQTPFALLGATTRDDARHIVQLSEERSLDIDPDICQKARSDLTNLRTRLSAEIAWLPGVSPRKASQLLEALLADPISVRDEEGLPTLAQMNLLAAAFESVEEDHDARDLAEFVEVVAELVDELDPEEVLRDINADRVVSRFAEVRTTELIVAELAERKRYYRNAIKEALNRLSALTLIEVMTDTVDSATTGGKEHAPELIDDLVDSYEVEAQDVLEKEAASIGKLIKAVRGCAASGEALVKPHLDKIDGVARNWHRIAQPILLSAKARGIDHDPSIDLALEIRDLAVDLFNDHNLPFQSQRLTGILQELFSELPSVGEKVKQDAEALERIFSSRKEAEARKASWARDVTYSAEIGLVFKDVLSISPDGMSWRGQRFRLESITRVRWGGVRHSVNGIPTGTSYRIGFGNERSEAVVETRRAEVFTSFTEKLWHAVGFRLLEEMLETLKQGDPLHFGDAILYDDCITLVRNGFFSSRERVKCSLGELHIWSNDGVFYMGARNDSKVYVGRSYMNHTNTHILELIIRMAFKRPELVRLSELIDGH
ncbi:MAG: hypothetical protein FWD68_18610 [Alphaproteobacteria bacterium]|nr:hypothetical protein [Alphaproteobacteria bacterium]